VAPSKRNFHSQKARKRRKVCAPTRFPNTVTGIREKGRGRRLPMPSAFRKAFVSATRALSDSNKAKNPVLPEIECCIILGWMFLLKKKKNGVTKDVAPPEGEPP
jgi:hypothetical protein